MKLMKLLIVSLFLFLPLATHAQSLDITVWSDHANHDQNTYPLGQSNLKILPNGLLIDSHEFTNLITWNYSEINNRVATVKQEDELMLSLFDPAGQRLLIQSLEFFDPADETLKIYPINNGRTVLRDNVANFTFLDPKGETLFSVSNSSQSADGERESRLAADDHGRTIVLYNPVISYGNTTGSRAKIVYAENHERLFFNSMEMEIQDLKVSSNGAFISLLAAGGGESVVLIYDRFGNELYRYETTDSLRGVNLSPKGDFITKFTTGRVQVFNTISGEVAGSSSSRGSVVDAFYFPEDETIIMLGGAISGLSISDPTVTAVHLGRRQIVREDVRESIASYDPAEIRFNREAEGQYLIKGLNKHLQIIAQF